MEAINLSKASSKGMSYGSTGVNSGQHLSIELLKKMTGANFIHVPYRGSGPAALGALAGEVPMTSTVASPRRLTTETSPGAAPAST